MAMLRTVGGLTWVPVICLAVACGGSSNPAQPQPVPTATPTPAPTPPQQPLTVIPPCSLPASSPSSPACTKPDSRMNRAVNDAIDRVLTVRTDLFDYNDVDGGPRILKYDAYMTAVAAALGEAGYCPHIDPEGEIGVKQDNSRNEQWIIASKAGWNPPVGNWVMRKYVGACSPSTF
jgi:hypothetical protein